MKLKKITLAEARKKALALLQRREKERKTDREIEYLRSRIDFIDEILDFNENSLKFLTETSIDMLLEEKFICEDKIERHSNEKLS